MDVVPLSDRYTRPRGPYFLDARSLECLPPTSRSLKHGCYGSGARRSVRRYVHLSLKRATYRVGWCARNPSHRIGQPHSNSMRRTSCGPSGVNHPVIKAERDDLMLISTQKKKDPLPSSPCHTAQEIILFWYHKPREKIGLPRAVGNQVINEAARTVSAESAEISESTKRLLDATHRRLFVMMSCTRRRFVYIRTRIVPSCTYHSRQRTRRPDSGPR
jgi:hypothetical protein